MGRVWLKVVPLYGQLPKPVVCTQYIPYSPGTFRCRGPQNTHYYLQWARRLDVPMRAQGGILEHDVKFPDWKCSSTKISFVTSFFVVIKKDQHLSGYPIC